MLVYNVDRTPNEIGQISEVIDIILWYKMYVEYTFFVVSSLSKQDLILGFT